MNIEEYYKSKDINNTSLGYLKKSFGHYKAFLEGNTKSTEPMRIGIALHEAILETDKFENNFEIKLEYKGEGIKARMQEQKERCIAEGKHLLSQTEWEMFLGIAQTLHADAFVVELLRNAKVELSLQWQYKGFNCKGRLDGIVPNMCIFDFKFVADANPQKFVWNAYKYGYHRQAFWYKQGAIENKLIGQNCPYYIIAVEKVQPFAYSIIEIEDSVIYEGKEEADMLLEKLRQYQKEPKSEFYGHYLWHSQNSEDKKVEEETQLLLQELDNFF